jgi:hypothetical protein
MHHYTGWHLWWHHYWGLVILIWIIGGSVWEGFKGTVRNWITGRREHQLELARIEARALLERAEAVPVAVETNPGPCKHRHATSVRNAADEIVAWLCKDCDTQLPPTWSVYEDEL